MSNATKRPKCLVPGCKGMALLRRYKVKDGTTRTCQFYTCAKHKKNGELKPHVANGSTRIKGWLEKGITFSIEEYDKLLSQQSGRCALCGKHWSELKNRLAVDHNHQTGKVRGLLCCMCNGNLGWFETFSKPILAYLNGKGT